MDCTLLSGQQCTVQYAIILLYCRVDLSEVCNVERPLFLVLKTWGAVEVVGGTKCGTEQWLSIRVRGVMKKRTTEMPREQKLNTKLPDGSRTLAGNCTVLLNSSERIIVGHPATFTVSELFG